MQLLLPTLLCNIVLYFICRLWQEQKKSLKSAARIIKFIIIVKFFAQMQKRRHDGFKSIDRFYCVFIGKLLFQ